MGAVGSFAVYLDGRLDAGGLNWSMCPEVDRLCPLFFSGFHCEANKCSLGDLGV